LKKEIIPTIPYFEDWFRRKLVYHKEAGNQGGGIGKYLALGAVAGRLGGGR